MTRESLLFFDYRGSVGKNSEEVGLFRLRNDGAIIVVDNSAIDRAVRNDHNADSGSVAAGNDDRGAGRTREHSERYDCGIRRGASDGCGKSGG